MERFNVGAKVKYVGAISNKNGKNAIVKGIKEDGKFIIEFEDGAVFTRVLKRNLEAVEEVAPIIEEAPCRGCSPVSNVEARETSTSRDSYSNRIVENPDHVYKYGTSTLAYKIEGNKIELKVDGGAMNINVALSILLKDEDLVSNVMNYKSPYRVEKDTNGEGITFIRRKFVNLDSMEEKKALCLRFTRQGLNGYQKVYIQDLKLALQDLGYVSVKTDGTIDITTVFQHYAIQDLTAPQETEREKKIRELRESGYIIPSSCQE